MNTDFLLNTVMPVLLVVLSFCAFVWFFKRQIEAEEKARGKLKIELDRFEAEKLSKKLKDFSLEIAVKKPRSFATKRKPQKKA